jgi:dihydroorotase
VTTRRIAIVNGHIIDAAANIDRQATLLIEDGRVAAVGKDLPLGGASVIDASGLVVMPGLVDLHVHLREPGFPKKETIATGSKAAAAGGFTTICCMPNTRPALDTPERIKGLLDVIDREADVRVLPIAAISKERKGDEPVDYDGLAAAGAIGFSDDGDSTMNAQVMMAALDASSRLGVPVMVHCEDPALAEGAIHQGSSAEALGLPGIDPIAEEIIISRDILLAELSGGWLHLLHVSTGRGAELVRRAKERGLLVTAEVMPHHLTMTDEWVAGDRTLVNTLEPSGQRGKPSDPLTKVNPPLRMKADAEALLDALKAGVFDIIATDHAPHAVPEKQGSELTSAAFGFTASELALPTMLALVRAGHLTLIDVVHRMSHIPARLLNLSSGSLLPGSDADLIIVDPNERWRVTSQSLRSKSSNTPLLGMEMQGRVRATFVRGVPVYEA